MIFYITCILQGRIPILRSLTEYLIILMNILSGTTNTRSQATSWDGWCPRRTLVRSCFPHVPSDLTRRNVILSIFCFPLCYFLLPMFINWTTLTWYLPFSFLIRFNFVSPFSGFLLNFNTMFVVDQSMQREQLMLYFSLLRR